MYISSSIYLTLHIVRTGMVFLPLIICSPLLLLPPTYCPTSTLLSLLAWCMETAGPVYIKLAQWASTRRDIFPVSVCAVLARLQRHTQPHSWRHTQQVLDREWGEGWEERVRLERAVVGSGCCAQVYRGVVEEEGKVKEVAVKVVHPGLYRQLKLDLMVVMSSVVKMITWLVPVIDWLSPERIVPREGSPGS